MNKKKLFSLPFNNKLTKKQLQNDYFPFIAEYKDYLYDIYFSVLVPPFSEDAMGQARVEKKKDTDILNLMLLVKQKYGIEVSATFNNILVEPSYENMITFIKNFKLLYDKGIRSVTLPHTQWMLTGEIKRHFPELKIKNTILRKVTTPQQYVDCCEAGFDVVNIDRANLRDRDNLKRLKRAYNRYKKPMVILVNESCRGRCPTMDEHYSINCTPNNKPYFKSKIAQYTCPSWKRLDTAYNLKMANMPPYREDFDEILEYMQVLKLHGRSEGFLLYNSMDIVKSYVRGDKFLKPLSKSDFSKYDENKLKTWRKFTKNCKFECWDCNMCNELENSKEFDFAEELSF